MSKVSTLDGDEPIQKSSMNGATTSLEEEVHTGRPPEFNQNYTISKHLKVFEQALQSNEEDELGGPAELISAVPDWAPIKQRVKRSIKRNRDVVREGWAYHLARWPLLFTIFFLISIEFFLYLIVRQTVNFLEWAWAWRGQKVKIRQKLQKATHYDEWKEAAIEMDTYMGHDKWKSTAPNAYYDSGLVKRLRDNLKEYREKDDVDGVKTCLEVCLKSNFAGTENPRLYSETYYGSKDLLEDYVEEAVKSIHYLTHSDNLSIKEKSKFFRLVEKSFGSTALCLSGGASFGYYHFGVIRALLDADMLPRVISGTSAGALIAAFVCTHTDEELKRLLVPRLAEKITACEEPFRVWFKRYMKTGARFDGVAWAAKAHFFTMGSMTFREAYERTGRVLNVSVIPYETHSPTKLLNFITAPDCVIFSAIIASAAVPGILNPVTLLTKTKQGHVIPWQYQGKHKDGSLRVDIPLQSLHLLFNCSFSIVSQGEFKMCDFYVKDLIEYIITVNPHIHLFSFAARGAPGRPVTHRQGKGWRGGFFLSAAEHFLKIELTKNFRVIRDLELMPEFGGQNWTAVFLQKFEGSVTIHPKSRLWDWVRLLSDPDEPELDRMIDVGKRATWPRLHMIGNRLKIENQLDKGKDFIRRARQQPSTISNPYVDADTSALESDSDLDFTDTARKAMKQNAEEPEGHESFTSSPAKIRRKEIIRKLGLNRVARKSGENDAELSDRVEPIRAGESDIRRRVSTGELLLSRRVLSRRRAPESSDEGEEGYSSG